jgi:multidrug resistance efflux pump
LPSVEAVYTWVRLAQRIPVRIKIDSVPPTITLAAGLTATLPLQPPRQRPCTGYELFGAL